VLFASLLTAPAVGAQGAVPDSLLRAASSAAPKCKIVEVRRLAVDTAFVSLIDSLLTAESSYDGEWRLCDGSARNQTTRDAAHAILRPLWAAWGADVHIKAAVLNIRSIDPAEANVRMVIWAPQPAQPKVSGGR
jgi:hypothetical protein